MAEGIIVKLLKENFEVREYQKAIAENAIKKNTLVVLPTGVGKTYVAMLVVANRLENYPQSKALILAPTRPLVNQHKETFMKHFNLEQESFAALTGKIPKEKRANIYGKAKIFFATPQLINFDIDAGRLNLSDFSLLVIDECVSGETRILMPNSYETAENLANKFFNEENQRFIELKERINVLSNNPFSGEEVEGRITGIWRVPTSTKKVVEIELETGCKLTLSGDHPIFTKSSWKRAMECKNSFVLYKPFRKEFKTLIKDKTIIEEKDIRKICEKYSLPKRHVIEELRNLGLLPLNLKNPKFRTIMKILGHLYGDGWISINKQLGFSGEIEDLKEIIKDLAKLDPSIKQKKITSRITYSAKYGIKGETNQFNIGKYSLWCLFVALGCPIGEKASQKFLLPNWLLKLPKNYLQDFLSSFCGSELDKISPRKGTCSFFSPRIPISKVEHLRENGLMFATQIKKIFNKLGVTVSSVSIKPGNIRKDGKKTIKLEIKLSNSNRNLINFLRNVGFNYASAKEDFGKAVLTYLLIKERVRKNRMITHMKAKELRRRGYCYRKIAEKLNIFDQHKRPYATLIPRILSDSYGSHVKIKPFDLWFKESYYGKGNSWVRVIEVKNSNYKKRWLYDFEISCDDHPEIHTYYANGILVHNCHRSVKRYPYPAIAKKYVEQSKFPLILGLTASPGGKYERIAKICENLFIEAVEIRTEKDLDVLPYIQPIKKEWINVELPEDFKKVKILFEDILKENLLWLRDHRWLQTLKPTKKLLLKLQEEITNRYVEGGKNYSLFWAMMKVIESVKIEHALELLETQGIFALMEYMEKIQLSKKMTDKRLVKDSRIREALKLIQNLYSQGIDHPKLEKVKYVIKDLLKENQKARIIVFANYRSTIDKINKYLRENGISSEILIGQSIKEGRGLKQEEQIKILERFNDGNFNVLVASSIGEEGLSIVNVDVVIFFDSVASEIRRIQRYGRTGRTAPGKVIFLITKGTRDEGYYWSSFHRERRMKNILYDMRERGVKIKREKIKPHKTLFDWVEE
jgi:ERCC4-related helicase